MHTPGSLIVSFTQAFFPFAHEGAEAKEEEERNGRKEGKREES